MANGATFTPGGKYSSPTIESQITLHAEQAQRIFNRCFEGASRSLFTVDVIARALADTKKSFDHGEVMEAINTMMSNIEKDIVNTSGRFKILLDQNDKAGVTASYTNPAKMKFVISSPEILRFAKLLQAFDEMLRLYDACWLCDLVESQKAQSFRSEKMRMVMRLVRKLQEQAAMARRALHKVEDSEQIKQDLGELAELATENDAERASMAETQKFEEDAKNTAAA